MSANPLSRTARPTGRLRQRAAASTVWYLRLVALLNLVAVRPWSCSPWPPDRRAATTPRRPSTGGC
ncbi:hypothetical protein [Kitasatospora sp. Ki12]